MVLPWASLALTFPEKPILSGTGSLEGSWKDVELESDCALIGHGGSLMLNDFLTIGTVTEQVAPHTGSRAASRSQSH